MINIEGISVINEQNSDKMVEEMINQKKAELEALKGATNVKKNHKPGKPQAGRKYVLLANKLNSWGKVPDQQRDIAKVMVNNMEVGKEYTEAEVFELMNEQAVMYPSVANSVQDPTYLFRYYRGLKNDGKHAGFVGRDFIRVIG